MADDIVERLRSAWWGEVGADRTKAIQDAAAEIERLRASEARAVAERERVCTWAKEHDEGPYWTECKHAFECITDGPKENGFKHCCFCGGKIEVNEATT